MPNAQVDSRSIDGLTSHGSQLRVHHTTFTCQTFPHSAAATFLQNEGEREKELLYCACPLLDCDWNVMAHAQKPHFVFRRNGRVHLNRQGRQFNRLLEAEVCASAVVMLDTPCSEVVWRVLATHSIRQFPHSLPLPCVTVCHLISTGVYYITFVRASVYYTDL
jgi:hypothetical protein